MPAIQAADNKGKTRMDQFGEIRPYHDDEIRPVLDRLLETEDFIGNIAAFWLGRYYRLWPALWRAVARRRLRYQLRDVNDVGSMQDVIAGYMDKMIERTTTELTCSGLDALAPGNAYLFVSNHRDIAMDPAFVNYMLYHNGMKTLHIAIGDNLLKRPYVTDLMRLNKSFIVKRSLKGRELLQSSMLLSEYIHHLVDNSNNVWIAQREGRAKDGIDRTEAALLKMLVMAHRKQGVAEALQRLHIVPVAISYEFDACDALKAEELYQKAVSGSYQKNEHSDINSIVTGMMGFKGRVHVGFGEVLQAAADDVDAVAAQLDQQIIDNYRLHGVNYLALELLARSHPQWVPAMATLPEYELDDASRQRLLDRVAAVPEPVRPYLLQIYANPVISRFAQRASD